MALKIAHIVPSFYPALAYGGTTESVYHLCRAEAAAGAEVRVLTTNANGRDAVMSVQTHQEVWMEERFRVRYCPRRWVHSVSPRLLVEVSDYVAWADVVHLMAVYSFTTFPTLVACRRFRKPLVWSPRGGFSRWTGSRHVPLKKLWDSCSRRLAPTPLLFHATSEDEAAGISRQWSGAAIKIVPNGVEVPPLMERTPSDVMRLLFVGRLDPIKGIENLLDACLQLTPTVPWHLTVAGAGSPAYTASLRRRVQQAGLAPRVMFYGPVAGEAKEQLFRNSDAVVVPSYSENFGMVVAEALARGVPVIASRGTPWKGLADHGCGLWVDNTPTSLASAIQILRKQPLVEMGRRGRAWMEHDFHWASIAERMIALYEYFVPGQRMAA